MALAKGDCNMKSLSVLLIVIAILTTAAPAFAHDTCIGGTLNPADGLPEGWPREGSVVNFTKTFTEPVVDFDESDVVLSGPAKPTTVEVTGIGNVYNIAVSGMSDNGLVIVETKAIAGACEPDWYNLSFVEYFFDMTLEDFTIYLPIVARP
jgi:hypothetical protein